MLNKISILIILFTNTAFCQYSISDNTCGSSSLASQTGVTACFSNIAGLTDIKKTKAIASYSQTYCISELWNFSSIAIFKIQNRGILPIQVELSGPNNYINIKIKSGYAHQLFNRLSAGIKLTSEQILIKEHENIIKAGFETGILCKINNSMNCGLIIALPDLLHTAGKTIIIESAVGYDFHEKASLNIALKKNFMTNLEFICNVSCLVSRNSCLFLSYNTNSKQISCGFTLMTKSISISIITDINFILGVSPNITFVI